MANGSIEMGCNLNHIEPELIEAAAEERTALTSTLRWSRPAVRPGENRGCDLRSQRLFSFKNYTSDKSDYRKSSAWRTVHGEGSREKRLEKLSGIPRSCEFLRFSAERDLFGGCQKVVALVRVNLALLPGDQIPFPYNSH